MEIHNDKENQKVWTEKDGLVSKVQYECKDGTLNISSTYVPKELEGQGIAAQLVAFVSNYAKEQGYHLTATCPYARIWLMRHPQG